MSGDPMIEELERSFERMWEIATERFELDPFPIHFEVVPADIMHEIGAYALPGRFSHWTHGQAYRQIKTHYDSGLSRAYEVVINSNPSQAFLLDANPAIVNKLVMAHVIGHVDFFKHNRCFQQTRRDMPHAVQVSAERISEFERLHGRAEVEKVLDAALTVMEHIDMRNIARPSPSRQIEMWREEMASSVRQTPPSEYDDLIGRPAKSLPDLSKLRIPLHPDPDLLGFIADFAPYLEDWQRDLLQMVRFESIYFRPQMLTKIMNEGWASYWHKRIMMALSEEDAIKQEEDEGWIALHARICSSSPYHFNPYYTGLKVWEWIEDYWNGNLTEQEKRWLEKDEIPVQPRFEGPLEKSPALAMLREVRKEEDDAAFIRNHFDRVSCARMQFQFHTELDKGQHSDLVVVDTEWRSLRDRLAASLAMRIPRLDVVDSDHAGKGELLIRHLHEGRDLDHSYVEKTLPHLRLLWGRTVHLETVLDEKAVRYSCGENGKVERMAA